MLKSEKLSLNSTKLTDPDYAVSFSKGFSS